ncbi:MAG: hypothetical protein ABSE49_36255, partial [Polyangiaceae bacterium]
MTPRATLRWFGITAFVLAVAGSATAQTNGSGTGTAPLPPPDGQVVFVNNANLSPQQMIAAANAALSQMQGASGTVGRQLQQARQSRDVVKTLCLNDKLSQIDVTTRSAQDRFSQLQAAITRGDIEGAHHHFSILTAHQQHSQQISSEANQCVGEELAFVGQTTVDTQVYDGIVDAYEDPATGVIVLVPVPPSAVSPTK